MNSKDMDFTYIVSEGTPYEVGKTLGSYFKKETAFLEFMTSPFMGRDKLNQHQINKAMEFFDKYCPGINAEIKGFSDSIGVDSEKIVYYFSFIQPAAQHCSQAVILPSLTEDGHTYHIRSYEWGWDEKQYHTLFTTRANGKPAYIGFGLQLFGRFEGMNEYGLCVTTTSGVMGMPMLNQEGFVFPGVVRTILDQCSSVYEAIDVIQEIPICDYRNFLISDPSGNAVVVEVASSHKAVKIIRDSPSSEKFLISTDHYNLPEMKAEKFLVSTNHYSLPEMKEQFDGGMWNSVVRYQTISRRLRETPTINKAVLKEMLSNKFPDGLCCHHYNEGFGTLWSMIFDTTQKNVEICFGSPQMNKWSNFSLKDPIGKTRYQGVLPDEPSDSRFWSTIQSE